MIGTKLYKGQFTNAGYADLAVWCNANNATIEDKGEYYECVAIPIHVPTEQEIQKALENGIEAWMNETVQQRNYKDIVSACSYAVSTDETFAKEGQACIVWRDTCWRKCYEMLAEVKAGTRPIPTLEEVITELPKLEW